MPITNNKLLITSATVFPDRARVTRLGRLSLTTGLQRVAVADLPLALVTDSVRAGGSGTAKAKLLGVSTHLEQYLETPAEAVRELETKIQATEDAEADLAGRAAVLEKEIKSLDTLAAQSEMFARGLALRNRAPEEQGAIFDFITARAQTRQAEVLRIGRERRERAKELDQLRRQLKNAQAARPRQRYTATVELEVLTAGDLDLELTYVVTGASWTPLYDLRYSDGNASLNVAYLAQVAQNTGEDWTDVALTLSTAQPALALLIPELDPWFVQPLPPPRPKMVTRAMAAAPAAFPAQAADQMQVLAAAAEPDSYELAADSATISDSGPSLTYRLSGRADIPGNNDPRKVTVATFSLKPVLDYVTAPKKEQVCYRRVTIKNESGYTLLPGPAQLFEGDDYLGATRLDFTAPGQEFELALGADERLRAERELAQRDVDKTFIGDRRRIRFAYTIKLENLRDAPQTVLVRDQLPVPRDEQIKVKLESAEPKPAKQTDLNQLEWKLTLDKQSKQTIRFDFTVEYPRSMEVIGLP